MNRKKPAASSSWWKPGLAAAAAFVLCLQVVVLTRQAPEPNVHLLSAEFGSISEPAWLIQLELDPALSWAHTTALLTTLNARLVDGPGSAGLVRILVAKNASAFKDRGALEDHLLTIPGVIHAAVEAEL